MRVRDSLRRFQRPAARLRGFAVAASAVAQREGRRAWAGAARTRHRTRIAVGVAAALGVMIGLLGMTTASAANEARKELNALIDEAGTLTFAQLLETSTYVRLAEQSARTEEAVKELSSTLRPFAPLEFLPFLGSRIRAARNTAQLGEELSFAATRVLTAYGDALDARKLGEASSVADVVRRQHSALAEAEVALRRAEALAREPLVLSDRQTTLVNAAIGALRSLTVIGIASPGSVDDGLELLQRAFDLRKLIDDPLAALADSQAVGRHIGVVRRRTELLSAELVRLSEAEGAPAATLTLALDGLMVISEVAEAAAALLSVGDALELGFLSAEFGAETGPLLASAQAHLDEARSRLSALEESFSSGIGGQLADAGVLDPGLPGVFQPAREALDDTADAVSALRSFLGFERPRTYLLFLQNQNEIRATGGFVGATVELSLASGVLADLVYDDSTRIDSPPLINNPPAPEPLFWYLWMGRLLFRDANWNPHFATSARTLMDFYEHSRGVELDGAISATKLLALDLVDLFGDITVPGVREPLTRDLANLYIEGELPYTCTERHVSTKRKRCFDEDLVPAVIGRLRAGLNDDQRAAFVSVLGEHLSRKNVMIYAEDIATQELITANGWGGAVPSPTQDFLMVIDSSLPGHTTAAINRAWDYQVSLATEGPSRGQLRVRYANHRPVPDPDCRQAAEGGGGCYWNSARVFLSPFVENVQPPVVGLHEGSEKLIWGHRDLDSGQLLTHGGSAGLTDLVEVGGFLVVEPGSVLTVPVSFDLGTEVVRSVGPGRYEYRLMLAKQPGMDRDEVSIEVLLPPGTRPLTVSPATMSVNGSTVVWKDTLLKDTELIVVFESSRTQ